MTKIRISGLVKAMNRVRRQLTAGIPQSGVEDFRLQVMALLAEVEKICQEHGISPEQLPGPSARAYRFLNNLDLNNLPIVAEGSPEPPKTFRVAGLLSVCKKLHAELDRLACQASAEPGFDPAGTQAVLMRDIQSHAAHVEDLARQAGSTPAALPVRSRRAYQWLKFLSEPANLEAHISTLAAGQQRFNELGRLRSPAGPPKNKLQMELFHTTYLYRIFPARTRTRIVVNEGFIGAPPEVIRALMLAALGEGTDADVKVLRAYAGSEDFAEVVQTLEWIGHEPGTLTQGRQYNLEEVFANVNARYFERRMPRPQLTWNQTLSRRKWGHYQPSSDTVMISITLDDPEVPPYVIEFVMYHELLHKKLGVQNIDGRRYVHTTAFRKKEKQFRGFNQARDYLRKLASD